MKQYILIICTSVILMALVIIGAEYQVKSDQLQPVQPQTTVSENIYLLKNFNGKLSVFKRGESEPIITTDTLVGDLPQSDRESLAKGFEVRGDKNLRIALEDYCS